MNSVVYKPFTPRIIKEIEKMLIPRAKLAIDTKPPSDDKHKSRSERKACVLLPLLNYRNQPCILYTLRSANVSTAMNEVSFPGGHIEQNESILDSALREFYEECGIHFSFSISSKIPKNANIFNNANVSNDILYDKQSFEDNGLLEQENKNIINIHILGSLFHTCPSKYGTPVHPIVAYLELNSFHDKKQSDVISLMKPCSNEVSDVYCVPISELLTPSNCEYDDLSWRGRVPRFQCPSSEQPIWGLTGYLSHQLMYNVVRDAFRFEFR